MDNTMWPESRPAATPVVVAVARREGRSGHGTRGEVWAGSREGRGVWGGGRSSGGMGRQYWRGEPGAANRDFCQLFTMRAFVG
jgi:hypothetical protein